ncbi:hypothetical protein GF325_12340 [Candidatus Bathyarchaeota archaeon]|nr:hypothetical protein [Candidatus Bathyarchaeota archaeon]
MKNKSRAMMIPVAIAFACAISFMSPSYHGNMEFSFENTRNGGMQPSVLGDVEDVLPLPFDPVDITHASGIIWVISMGETKIYQVNPIARTVGSSINITFTAAGLTTDGTYLYASKDEPGNGTIAKYGFDGTFISEFELAITTGYLQGLTWDGSHLWASQWNPHRILRIDPSTGAVVANHSSGFPFSGITWRDGLIWGSDYNDNIIRAVDPATGRTREVFDPPHTVGEYGLATNGSHFFFSEWGGDRLHVLPIPKDLGAVWTQYSSPNSLPSDIARNDTHVFIGDNTASNYRVYVLHDGTFEQESNFSVPFEIYGLALVDDYLYIGQYNAPYTIHKYTRDGMYMENFSSAYRYYSLDYDGSRLWGSVHIGSNTITELDPVDCSILATYPVEANYMGITHDTISDVFWATAFNADKIFQLDPSNFQQTGLELDVPTGNGEFGLKFNGEHLLLTEHGVDMIYKIIIDETAPTSEIIPTADTFTRKEGITLSFKLLDEYKSGHFQITSNSSYSKEWTAWSNDTTITERITDLGLGTWQFTVEFNDTFGHCGVPFTFVKTVVKNPAIPGIPTNQLLTGVAVAAITILIANHLRMKKKDPTR